MAALKGPVVLVERVLKKYTQVKVPLPYKKKKNGMSWSKILAYLKVLMISG